jgi:hypothetical protein
MTGRQADQFAREHKMRIYAGEGSAGASVARECVFCLKRQTILAGKARLRGSPPGFFKLFISSRSIRICQSQNPILAISPFGNGLRARWGDDQSQKAFPCCSMQ